MAGLVCALGIAYAIIYIQTEMRFNRQYVVEAAELTIPSDSASLATGEHLAQIKGCQDCHSENLAGKVFLDDPALGRIVATNLTKGKGGLPADYSDADWVRALRHGINRDGKPLLIMPSDEIAQLSDQDLTALIAYCQRITPVDQPMPTQQVGPVGRLLMAFDKIPMLRAEKIDHTAPSKASISPAISKEYGAYLSASCTGCHRENLQGGPPLAPGFPPVPDLTTQGNLGHWTEQEFIQTLRTGNTPEGKHLRKQYMPWQMTQKYTELELKALWLYLHSLPKQALVKR